MSTFTLQRHDAVLQGYRYVENHLRLIRYWLKQSHREPMLSRCCSDLKRFIRSTAGSLSNVHSEAEARRLYELAHDLEMFTFASDNDVDEIAERAGLQIPPLRSLVGDAWRSRSRAYRY